MIDFLILSALTSAFIILFSSVTGVRASIELSAPALLSKIAGCDFCLSFWVNLVFTTATALFAAQPLQNIFIALPATALTWFIISVR